MPVKAAEPVLQQLQLLLALIAQHPTLPAVIEILPTHAQLVEPGQLAIAQRRERLIVEKAILFGQGLFQALLDTLWGDLESGVDAAPALPGQPVLDPGMGVELAHLEVVAVGVELTALVTGDHSRWNARRAQHEGHGAGIVRAEATPGVEQELVDAVTPQRLRTQCIDVGLAVEMLQHGRHQRIALRVLRLQLGGPGTAARITLLGQLQRLAHARRLGLRLTHGLRPGTHLVQQRPIHRAQALPTEVAHHAPALLRHLANVQSEQPALATGLHDDAVIERLSGLAPLRRDRHFRVIGLRPAPTIEALQRQSAPVQLHPRRHFALETGTKGQRRGTAEFGNIGRLHAVREPGDALVVGQRQRPKRPHARKEHEQQHHQRYRLQHQAAGQAQGRPGALGKTAVLQADQCSQQCRDRQQAVERGQNAVLEQVSGHHAEEAEEDHHQRVTPRTHLQQFEGESGDQQHRCRIQPHQGATRQQDTGQYQQHQAALGPASGVARTHAEDLHAPTGSAEPQRDHPHRQVHQVRHDHQHLCYQQPNQGDPRDTWQAAHGRAPNSARARRQASRWPSP